MYNSLLHPQLSCLDIRTAGQWCKFCLRHKWPSSLSGLDLILTPAAWTGYWVPLHKLCYKRNYVQRNWHIYAISTHLKKKKKVLPAISPGLSFFFCSGRLSVGYTVTAVFCFAGCRWRWVGSLQASLHCVWVVVLGKCVHILEIRTCPLHWKVTKHSLNSNRN